MRSEAWAVAASLFNLSFAVFHVFFWRLFRWKQELARLSFLNRAIMQVMNLCLIAVFLAFAYVSMFHSEELMGTALGRSLLVFIALFWFLRALEQIAFFTLRRPISIAFFMAFLGGALIYAYPLARL